MHHIQFSLCMLLFESLKTVICFWSLLYSPTQYLFDKNKNKTKNSETVNNIKIETFFLYLNIL